MKSSTAISTILCLFAICRATGAAEPDIELRAEPDGDKKSMIVLTAKHEDVSKVWSWRPGDVDLISLKEMVHLAEKRLVPPKGAAPKPEMLIGVDWRFGRDGTWIAAVRFLFGPQEIPGKLPVRDGGEQYATVYMLPNGAPIAESKRPMSRMEMIDWGLAKPTEEEMKEFRKQAADSDPFK